MNDYDVGMAFRRIEDELIGSMIRNLKHHKAEETKEGFQWDMWQVEQLKSLERYRQKNRKKYGSEFASLNKQIGELIRSAKQEGGMSQEVRILQAIKRGYKGIGKNLSGKVVQTSAEFFRINERKLDALIKAATNDMKKAETAILRMTDDRYRKIIYDAQIYANTGAGTYGKAVDMATKDMLSSGLNCVEYKNGARHTLSDYADMAIRTASKRAYLQGEGEKRQEWGISTVIMNKRGNPCPKCLPFVGKVLIDDVWSGGKASDGSYPLMSSAISAGLYHPRCKDSHTTYFPEISTADDTWTQEELEAVKKENEKEAKLQYASKQAERFERLAKYSLDVGNKSEYQRKSVEWNKNVESILRNSYDNFKEYRITRNDKLPVMLKDKIKLRETIYTLPEKIQDALKDIEFRLGSTMGSGYSPSEKAVYLSDSASKRELLHEIGHVYEELLDKDKVDELKKKYTEGLASKNIVQRKAVDSSGNTDIIYLLKNDRFIDDYQGRLYIDDVSQAVTQEGRIDTDKLEEFISVAFDYAITYPKTMLKHHPELYSLILGGIK